MLVLLGLERRGSLGLRTCCVKLCASVQWLPGIQADEVSGGGALSARGGSLVEEEGVGMMSCWS